MDDQLESVAQIKNTRIDLAIRFGPKVLAALLILAVGLFVGRWIGRALEQMPKKLHLDAPIRLLLVRIVRVLIIQWRRARSIRPSSKPSGRGKSLSHSRSAKCVCSVTPLEIAGERVPRLSGLRRQASSD
jgi:hypothetical protein